MQLLAISALAIAAIASASDVEVAGQYEARMALSVLMNRQTRLCQPVTQPYTCERSCGAGFVECVKWPTCYNPGRGDTCCSNGSYCPSGSYCTNNGCCPNGRTLSQCGAKTSLSVIPPPPPQATSSSARPPASSSSSTRPSTTSSAKLSTSKTTSTQDPTTQESSTETEPAFPPIATSPTTSSSRPISPPAPTAQGEKTFGTVSMIAGLVALLLAL